MKKKLPLFMILACMAIVTHSNAQCDFTPVITPDKPILCPGAKDTLITTEAFENYQWYRNNKPIDGATNRYYVVHQYEDGGAIFKVEATRNGCTAFSKRVLVDGYVFASPIIIETGDIGVYDIYRDALVECPNDTIVLTMGTPYTQNLQWYNNSKPIKGANEQSYTVTKKGSYTVCGSPELCPTFKGCELIPVNITFDKPEAGITEKNDTLFASVAKQYQWFFNERPIPGADKNYLAPQRNGSYTVATINKYNCSATSQPFIYTANLKKNDFVIASPNPVLDVLHIRIKTNNCRQIILSNLYGNVVKQVAVRSSDINLPVSDLQTGTYLLQLINTDKQAIGSVKIYKQ